MASKEIFPGGSIPPTCTGEKHVACVVLVDTSGSMTENNNIQQANDGIRMLVEQILSDSQASGVVDICLIEFNNSVNVVCPFAPVSKVEVPRLRADGGTSMNEAILVGLDQIAQRKQLYKSIGTPYWRPWMFLITDGYPTDDSLESQAKGTLSKALEAGKVVFFPVAVADADENHLATYPSTATFKVSDNDFTRAFVWLSQSIISNSKVDTSEASLSLPQFPGEPIKINIT